MEIQSQKMYMAFIAARLAESLHKGQVDKAGKDYFTGHLSAVGGSGAGWKEKVVGFLHDAAEDTGHTVKEVITALKKGEQEWFRYPERRGWIYNYAFLYSLLMPEKTPGLSDISLLLTEEEWVEVAEALNLMNSRTAESRQAYIARFKGHRLAIKVKLNDLRHNMDLSRLPHPSEKDFVRLARYRKEYQILKSMLKETED